jgi:hypothetical protein
MLELILWKWGKKRANLRFLDEFIDYFKSKEWGRGGLRGNRTRIYADLAD